MLQICKTYHLKKEKEKNYEKLKKMQGKINYLFQSYQGGYVNIKLFLILIQAVDKTSRFVILANSVDPAKCANFQNSF